jgi:CcmD family protein
MENAGYFFAVTGIIWAGVFGYLLYLMGRQNRLRQEIDTLKQLVAERTARK